MQEESILFSKKACWIFAGVAVGLSALVTSLLARNALEWLFCAGTLTCLGARAASVLANRVIVGRLKEMFPENAQKFEDYNFGTFSIRKWWMIDVDYMRPLIQSSPDAEKMIAERNYVSKFFLIMLLCTLPFELFSICFL